MTRSLLTDHPAGYEFEPFRVDLSLEHIRAYLGATGDGLSLYEKAGIAPPLAVAAFALGTMLNSVGLPDGALHGSEMVEAHGSVPIGAAVECRASIAQRSQRSGWVASVLLAEIVYAGETVLTARSTVLSPLAGAAEAPA